MRVIVQYSVVVRAIDGTSLSGFFLSNTSAKSRDLGGDVGMGDAASGEEKVTLNERMAIVSSLSSDFRNSSYLRKSWIGGLTSVEIEIHDSCSKHQRVDEEME